MKEKPDLQDHHILDQLQQEYGLHAAGLEFLPIGDISSAKYRVVTDTQAAYFLKMRKDGFRAISVMTPNFLQERGIHQVIAPVKTKDGRLFTTLDAYILILYPWIDGQNGFQSMLSSAQWIEFGKALRKVHSVKLPPDLEQELPTDTFAPHWRALLREFLAQAETNAYQDPVAAELAASLHNHQEEIRFVVERAEGLGKALQAQPAGRVLCHADIHAGNLLLERNGALHITDWDDPVIAPKERDLMFIGGGIGGTWNTQQEEASFYQGYGETVINRAAITYYRYERIVSDITEFCQQILLSTQGGADRVRSLQKYYSIFEPNQVLEIALQTDRAFKSG